jgi:hypothetical protein
MGFSKSTTMGLMNDLFVFIVESLKMFYNLLGSLHPEFSDSSL